MRSKYGEYPEYHTSLDNLDFITPQGLSGGFTALRRALECIEQNKIPRVTVTCEPQLGKRGLYPTLSTKKFNQEVRTMMNLLAYSDGQKDMLDIAELIGVPLWELAPMASRLAEQGLLELSR
jgi:aminopeptidase-like protein